MPMSTVVAAPLSVRRMRWPVTEERRTVTVLFVDIVGSTGLVERLDPEDVRALQRVYFGTVARVLRRWDGAVEKYVGDAVMALFGARTGDGWEAYRAVRAGLEIQRALDRRPLATAPGLRVRVGVATGEAVVDLTVGHDGGHGVASGAVITLAARLQEYAPPGGVAVCPATHRAVAGLIAQRRVPAVAVAGKALPVDVWHVTGTLRPRPARPDGPLVGRRRELATAREQLAEAVRGRGHRRLVLAGPPGSGRSRLLRELVRSTPTVDGVPVRWCVAACPPYPDGPLAPVADLVRGLAGARVTDDPEVVRRQLATALGRLVPAECLAPALDTMDGLLGAAGAVAGARAAAHWRDVLLSLARRQPVVVAVDDLDRAAPALRRHLDTLVDLATADGLPLVLVATGTEDTGDPARPAARVGLRPLDAVTTGRLLRQLLRRTGRPIGLVRQLVPLVGGNPGHAVAYVRALGSADAARLPVPESVRRLAEARLDRLDGPRRAALMAVAALPPGCAATELARALGWPVGQVESALDALAGAGLLVPLPAGGHDFVDPVLRQVAGARLPRSVRATFARRAATVAPSGPAGCATTGRAATAQPTACAATARPTGIAVPAPSVGGQKGQDAVPGQVGGDRIVIGHGRVGEQVSRPRVAVHHDLRTGGGHLPLPLVHLVGGVVGVRIGQVQVDPQAGPDRRRRTTGAVQQQQAGGGGALGQQRAGHPGTHREPGEHGVGRQPVERCPGPVEDGLLTDPVEQGEALLDGVDGRYPVQVGRAHVVPGGAQPVGGGQHRRPQPVHGVEEHDVSHRHIVPETPDSARPGARRARAVGWTAAPGVWRPVPVPRFSRDRRPRPERPRHQGPAGGRGCVHGTRRRSPHPRGSP